MRASVTFRNIGEYSITIGRQKLLPGGSCVETLDLPPEWDECEISVGLARPEEAGVLYRDPNGIIELAKRSGRAVGSSDQSILD